jgi:hypothetical protein
MHLTNGWNLTSDGTLTTGYDLVGVDKVATSFTDGTAVAAHVQSTYAIALRSQGLPEVINDGFDGYPHAGKTDSIAATLFYWAPPWPFASPVPVPTFSGAMTMPCIVSLYMQNKANPPLGFQEVYYHPSDDVNTALFAFAGVTSPSGGSSSRTNIVAGSLVDQRLGFLSKSILLYAVRASHVGSPKASRVIKFVNPGIGKINSDTDTIEASIAYFGFSAGQTVKRQFHFRGIANTWLDGDQVFGNGLTIGIPLIEGWFSSLRSAGVVILGNNTTIGSGTKIQGAQKATQTDPITLLLAANPGFTEGQLITLTGAKGNPLLNGRWLIGLTTPNTAIILKGSARYSAPTDLGGVVRSTDLLGFGLDSWQFNGVSSKKTGRPSYLQRGRRSAIIRHR